METEKEIHSRMLSNVGDEYDKSDGSFIYDATKPAAIEFEKQQQDIAIVQGKMDIENLIGDELARFVYQRTGITRKPATTATTTVVISGAEGSVINQGDLVGTDTLNFVVLESVIIPQSGQVSVLVASQLEGAIGNVPANSINRFPVSIIGLINVFNPEAVRNGYEAETDAELKERYYDKLQRPGKAGNPYHYEEWAKEVIGVGDVRVFPKFNGPLTMKVVIIDANKQPADDGLVSKTLEHISNEMPFGVDELVVLSATPVPIDITVNLTLASGYTEAMVIGNIKENIETYLKKIAFNTTFVSYAKIGSEIIDSEGVLDYQNLLVNGTIANVPIGVEEIATVGGVNE